ncbi:hypothetical protein ACAX43_11660 [Paraburkholderia sp. IW21]|uniref:hypothetical protein n=1 Tax=Paraburkholderia sp. IW21 TaxID=3242488 RepID=UPI00351FD4C5
MPDDLFVGQIKCVLQITISASSATKTTIGVFRGATNEIQADGAVLVRCVISLGAASFHFEKHAD